MLFLLLGVSRVTAFALLLLSLFIPWFRVPISVRENLDGACQVVFSEPASTIAFKIFVLVVLLSTGWLGYRRKRSGSTKWANPIIMNGCILLAVLGIAYPAFTMQRCAEVSAHAGWLQAQNYSLILPFGDAYRAQEYAQEPGQPLTNVAEVLPRAFEALPTPAVINSFLDLRLSKLEEILMWLGFSPSFCQFIYRGWFCGIFGAFLLSVSFMRMGGEENAASVKVRLLPSAPLILVCATFLLSTVCLIPVVMAGRELSRARTAVAEGRLSESLHHLDLMQAWLPVLAYNTDVVYQRGWLERKLGFNSEAAQLYSAMREEEEDFDSRAAQHYSEAIHRKADGPVGDEAYRGALRLAVKDFNAGLIDRAAERLGQLEAIDPTCIKANYALQLTYLQTFRKEELEREVARFVALYGCFQSLEKSGLVASAHRRMAELDFDSRDILKLGDEMRAAIKP
jgi:tetratricopeptide (TPR) repeat protein